jgi:helix-turn-helix protein
MAFERRDLLTADDVARILRVPVSWVYKHTRAACRDPLPHVKIGKYLRFFEGDILTYAGGTRPGHDNSAIHTLTSPLRQQRAGVSVQDDDRTLV